MVKILDMDLVPLSVLTFISVVLVCNVFFFLMIVLIRFHQIHVDVHDNFTC